MNVFYIIALIIFPLNAEIITSINHETLLNSYKQIFKENGANIAAILTVPPGCKSCSKYEEIWKSLSEDAMPGIVYYKSESASLPWMKDQLAPGMIFVNNDRKFLYQDDLTSESVFHAIRSTSDVHAFHLDDTSFEHDTQASTGSTTGDWLVIFNEEYENHMPVYEGLALRLRPSHCNVALVRPSTAQRTVKRFDIGKNPPVLYIRKGNSYFHEFDSKDHEQLYKFASSWYKNARKIPVPREISPFDELVEKIVQELKNVENRFGANIVWGVFLGGIGFVLLIVFVVSKTCSPNKKSKPEKRKKKE